MNALDTFWCAVMSANKASELCIATNCRKAALRGALLCRTHFLEIGREVFAAERDRLNQGGEPIVLPELRLGDILHQRVAALFVQPDGHYVGLDGVETWDEQRDARKYQGPYPVVAHPPCNLWVSFAYVNYKRYGGDHNKPGNDGGCFASALASVRRCGGVLEHPAFSHAWGPHGIPFPREKGWNACGNDEWVCEIWQSAYGHRARKRTWLFYKGVVKPAEMRWERKPADFQIGYYDQRGPAGNKPTVGKKEASRTPIALRDALLALARTSRYGSSSERVHLGPIIPGDSQCENGDCWCWQKPEPEYVK